MPRLNKVLFVLRKSQKKILQARGSYGLSNSSSFIVNKLNKLGYDARIVQVDDNNQIDKEVTAFKPDLVIIEALWVVPQKFPELLRIHRKPQWLIRIHSKAPFLALEGVAMDWMYGYDAVSQLYSNLRMSCNNQQFNNELNVCKNFNSIYLPNIYCPYFESIHAPAKPDDGSRPIDIGCFGAVRPLKNQLLQGIAAIMFGKQVNRRINFHINGTRPEQSGENVLRNLRGLFAGTAHKLVEHEWYSHKEFAHDLVPSMDLGMQVSFSESFNIVTADFVYSGVPIIVSEDVDWMPSFARVTPNSAEEMAKKLNHLWKARSTRMNQQTTRALENYNDVATTYWEKYLDNEK